MRFQWVKIKRARFEKFFIHMMWVWKFSTGGVTSSLNCKLCGMFRAVVLMLTVVATAVVRSLIRGYHIAVDAPVDAAETNTDAHLAQLDHAGRLSSLQTFNAVHVGGITVDENLSVDKCVLSGARHTALWALPMGCARKSCL